MKAETQHDGDPRYAWASVDLEGATTGLVVVHTLRGSLGFIFCERDQSMRPTCLCDSWEQSECTCPHLGPDYWTQIQEEYYG